MPIKGSARRARTKQRDEFHEMSQECDDIWPFAGKDRAKAYDLWRLFPSGNNQQLHYRLHTKHA